MSLLDSFKKINLNSNAPSVSISNYGLTFNKTVLDIMGSPNYVDLFLDEGGKRLAIKQTDCETSTAFCANKSNQVNARINNKDFSRKLFNLMNWEYKNSSYKVVGTWHSEELVFIFDLNQATENSPTHKDSSES